MTINIVKTREHYKETLSESYYDYLLKRGINSTSYIQALRGGLFGVLDENCIVIDGYDYCIRCVLGMSEENIYDLIQTNVLYGLSPAEGTVIAVTEGDDYMFLKPDEDTVYFCFREDEEITRVADNYEAFISMIK